MNTEQQPYMLPDVIFNVQPTTCVCVCRSIHVHMHRQPCVHTVVGRVDALPLRTGCWEGGPDYVVAERLAGGCHGNMETRKRL